MLQFLKMGKALNRSYNPPKAPVTCTHPVHQVDPPHGADLGRVVDEADVPLGGGIQLSHLNVPEAIEEIRPDVRPHPVADSNTNFVILIVVFLQEKNRTEVSIEKKQSPCLHIVTCRKFLSWELDRLFLT